MLQPVFIRIEIQIDPFYSPIVTGGPQPFSCNFYQSPSMAPNVDDDKGQKRLAAEQCATNHDIRKADHVDVR